ncbi:hypothetical protein Purlil1_13243 [Purpureocillium lilacinum]|uniref:Uncharacterized protein n=1 Tax=Purpureocillium lilacinum TaxID=33203 RepID=A0ABR0BEM3_PURLI|nr:hypothetical protein Purlil1_13243 [Purpureocillium lilacinum]
MDHWGRARTWRQSLADHLEKEHGPLPDLVATLGSNLITASPTPTVSSSIAGPDQDFVCKLHRKLTAAAERAVIKMSLTLHHGRWKIMPSGYFKERKEKQPNARHELLSHRRGRQSDLMRESRLCSRVTANEGAAPGLPNRSENDRGETQIVHVLSVKSGHNKRPTFFNYVRRRRSWKILSVVPTPMRNDAIRNWR